MSSEIDKIISNFLKWKRKNKTGVNLRKNPKKTKELKYSLPTIRPDIYSVIHKLLKDRNADAVYKIVNHRSINKITDPELSEWAEQNFDEDSFNDPEYAKYLILWGYRDDFTKNISWAIPSKHAIEEILDFADGETILELGAGKGLWGGLLRATSNDPDQLIITDSGAWGYNDGFDVFTDIIKIDGIRALEAFPEAGVLLTVWPIGFGEEFTLDNFKGDKLVFVGDGEAAWFEGLFSEKFERDWELVKQVDIYNWSINVVDEVYLFRRRV